MKHLIATATLIATLAVSLVPASAANFTISPTSITLTNQPAADVVVTNVGTGVVRISVHAFAWSQTPDEPEKLTASERIVYYPELFALTPAGTQRIRVGVTGAPTDREQAYRLFVAELPSNAGTTSGAGVTFLGRVDMPIFVPPGNSIAQTRKPHIVASTVSGGSVRLTVVNDGTVHVRQSTLTLTGTDAGGTAVWQETKQVFYVLAGSTQNVAGAIPAATCGRLRSIAVRWSFRDGIADQTETIPVRPESCR